MPEVFPLPDLSEDYVIEYSYYSLDENGAVSAPELCDKYDPLPNTVQIQCKSAQIEDYYTYAVGLTELGYPLSDLTDTTAVFTFDGGYAVVLYSDDGLTIKVSGDFIMVPSRYGGQTYIQS